MPGFRKKESEIPSTVLQIDSEDMSRGQHDRVSCTVEYKGLIVGGTEYHPEKLGVSITRTIDVVPGEDPEATRQRIAGIDAVQEILFQSVQRTVSEKIGIVKKHIEKLKK